MQDPPKYIFHLGYLMCTYPLHPWKNSKVFNKEKKEMTNAEKDG